MKKSDYRKQFDGSNALFEAVWRVYLRTRLHMDIKDSDDVAEYLDYLAAQMVNDEKSRFYITG